MAKIIIYEDLLLDLIWRYSDLTREHEIHGRLVHPESIRPWTGKELVNCGFDPKNFRDISPDLYKKEKADLYLLDGLDGDCFRLIKKLPKNRTYINSNSPEINKRARELGLNLAGPRSTTETLQKIIDHLGGSK